MKTLDYFSTLLLLVFLLSGCSTGVKSAFQRDGKQVWEAKCNGFSRSIGDCHAQASDKCNGRYQEMGVDGTSSFVPINGQFTPVAKRSLLFTCTESPTE